MGTATKSRSSVGNPVYRRIGDDLRARVDAGEWLPGALMPSRRMLAAEYGVEVMTLQRAIADLLKEGILRADGGRGTFVDANRRVPAPPVDRGVQTVGLTEHEAQVGKASTRQVVVGVVADWVPLQDEPDDRWIAPVVRGLERVVTSEPNCIVTAAPRGTLSSLPILQQVETLLNENIDALVVVHKEGAVSRILPLLGSRSIPVVFVSSQSLGSRAVSVFYDSEYAGYVSCRHLIDQGFTDLLLVSPFEHEFVQARVTGATEALHDVGDSVRLKAIIGHMDLSSGGSQDNMAEVHASSYLDSLPGKALIAVNDHVAHGILRAASAAGMTAGTDFAIIGFDDLPESFSLGLSTVRPPLDEMGAEAGRLVMDAMRGRQISTQVKLSSRLIPRRTTCR